MFSMPANISRVFLGCLAILSVAGTIVAADKNPTPRSLDVDGVRLTIGPPDGLTMDVDGIPFSSASTLFAVKPDWSAKFYGYDSDHDLLNHMKVSGDPARGFVASIALHSGNGDFDGTQTLELLPGRKLRMTLGAAVKADVKAQLENKIATINPAWLTGRNFTVKAGNSGSTAKVLMPEVAVSEDLKQSTLASGFGELTLDSRLGPIEIRASGNAPVSLVDYRKNKWANGQQYYWFGVLATPFEGHEPLKYEITIQFPPKSIALGEKKVATSKGVEQLPDVLAAETPEDRIIPTPKRITWHPDNMPLPNNTPIFIVGGAADLPVLERLTDSFIADIKREAGVRLRRITAKSNLKPGETSGAIVLRCSGGGIAGFYANDEQYIITPGTTYDISTITTAGAANSLCTLRQLVRHRDGVASIRKCDIQDYPSMPFRGIHFFSGKNASALQIRIIRDILGALKINTLVYQCDYTNWDSIPTAAHSKQYGMDKSGARAVADEARRQNIEVIPLVNTFGHSEWLLQSDLMKKYRENPDMAFAYDPSNLEVYKICERIYDEAIALFHPRTIHIGHDEITIEGFPSRPENKKTGATKLILDDIEHYRKFLADRKIGTMIWGDMFLGPGEAPDAALAPTVEKAKRRREQLSREIKIADWHYDPVNASDYKNLKILTDAGFDTIACTWHHAKNIVTFPKAVADLRAGNTTDTTSAKGTALGHLQTTWAGYSFDQKSFEEESNQYAAYVLAAEAAWTGGYTSPDQVPFDYRAEFSRIWNRNVLPSDGAHGWCADLNSVANFSLRADADGNWLGLSGTKDMSAFPVADGALGRFTFSLPGSKAEPKAVLLAGQFNPKGEWPESLKIPVGAQTSAIMFALASTQASPGKFPIGETTIRYEGGGSEKIEWKPGQNIFPLDDPASTTLAPILWQQKPEKPADAYRVVHGYLWQNPKPGTKVSEIEFISANRGAAVILFGVTGIQ